jgi:hypothetical protein
MRVRWRLFGLLLLGLGLLLSACQKVEEQLCEKVVLDKCHTCNPTLEKVARAANVTQLNKALFKEVKQCADTTLNATIVDKKWAEAAFKGCLSSSRQLDDQTRDSLIRQVESVKVSDQEFNAWTKCVVSYVYPGPLVLLMDSHVPSDVFCESTRKIKGSNADNISNLLKDLPIRIGYEPTNLAWQGQQHVLNESPDLVVVHASAFQEETATMDANTKLINFLNSLKGTRIRVLVYTRGLSAESSSETRERWERLIKALEDPDLKKNAELFVMPKGQQSCFEDPEVGVPFKEKIKAMLPAQP